MSNAAMTYDPAAHTMVVSAAGKVRWFDSLALALAFAGGRKGYTVRVAPTNTGCHSDCVCAKCSMVDYL